jgi:hypothetical protein
MSPPFHYFLPSPPPAAAPAPSSSLTQALVDKYAPMVRRELSYPPTDAAGSCWQQQQQQQQHRQHSHPSIVLPPSQLPPAPIVGTVISRWPSPTVPPLSPATLALLTPGDGMSTTNLDELPTFFLGQVLEETEVRRQRAVGPSPSIQHKDDHDHAQVEREEALQNATNGNQHHQQQRNVSCNTTYSDVRVQPCPAPLLLESPFMPMAGGLADLDERNNQRQRRHSIDSEGEHHSIGGSGDGDGEEDWDLLDGMDFQLLYQHFEEKDNGDAEPGSSGGFSTETAAAAIADVAEKSQPQRVASAEDTTTHRNYSGDYTQNIDLQTLFQSFVEDLEALPPLDLTAIGNPAAAARVSPSQYYDNNEEAPMSPVVGRKRGLSNVSFDPDTPEKKNISRGLGQHRQQHHNHRGSMDRKTFSIASPQPQTGSARRRVHVQAIPAPAPSVPRFEIVAMLPAPVKKVRRSLKHKIDGNQDNATAGEEDTNEAPYAASPSPHVPTRCVFLFGKTITASDAGKLARIVLPRAAVEQFLPRCESKNGIDMTLWDVHGKAFNVVLKFWMNGRPIAKRMWLLEQCQQIITALALEPGTRLDFYKADDGRLVVKAT